MIKRILRKIKRRLKRILKRIRLKFWYLLFPVLSKQAIDSNLVVFESFLGRKFNDSPRAIYEYMQTAQTDKKLVWIVNSPDNFDIPNAKMVKRFSARYFITLAKAKYIVNNSRMPNFFKKRSDQVYIQTWHGTPLKRLVYDMETNVMPNTSKDKYLKNFSSEVQNWDYLVTANHYSTEKFKSAFRFEGKFLEIGYPRNEFLYTHTEENRAGLRAKYGIKDEEIAILYTPTYRDNNNKGKGKYIQEMRLDLDLLNATPGIKVLLRLHYLVAETIESSKYENIIDVSEENDINELYIASDVLLNDYSSTMFDYLILKKPIILFPYDLQEYENDIRGFYMNYDELPAEQIKNTERLVEIVQDLKSYSMRWEKALGNFRDEMSFESEKEASKIIVESIIEKLY